MSNKQPTVVEQPKHKMPNNSAAAGDLKKTVSAKSQAPIKNSVGRARRVDNFDLDWRRWKLQGLTRCEVAQEMGLTCECPGCGTDVDDEIVLILFD